MVKRAITLGGDSPAAASFHRCAAIRESQRRYRANCSVDGVNETLTADLSRISGSFVVGRHTAFASKGEAFGPRKIRRERDVLLVLAGAAQRGGKWLRVSTPFVDAESGRHLWTGSFEKPVVDLFGTQDEIAARPANALDTESISAEALLAKDSLRADAVDLDLQGRARMNSRITAECTTQAVDSSERALVRGS